MSSRNRADAAAAARGRIDRSLDAVRLGLGPYVAKHMSDRYGERWRDHASRARGADAQGELDVYGLLKTLLDNWSELFRHDQKLRKARSFISLALWTRATASAHFSGEMSARETLRYLDAMRELLAAVEAKAEEATVEALYEEQRKANGVDRSPQSQLELEPAGAGAAPSLGEKSANPTRTCSKRASPMRSSPRTSRWSMRGWAPRSTPTLQRSSASPMRRKA